ncbi:MAG: NAD(P)-binding domain-containing protein [Rhodospirillales bacterium]
MRPNLGFIGLGFMGTPMVSSRLLSAGYNVWVWNRTRTKAMLEPLKARCV